MKQFTELERQARENYLNKLRSRENRMAKERLALRGKEPILSDSDAEQKTSDLQQNEKQRSDVLKQHVSAAIGSLPKYQTVGFLRSSCSVIEMS